MTRTPCSVDECDNPYRSRGLCNAHYQKWLKANPITKTAPPSPEEVFWASVDRSGGCWIWTGAKHERGYGEFSHSNGKRERAHRFSLQLKLGRPLVAGSYACHTCDTPSCVNPNHLYEGTPQTNISDAVSRGRNIRGTACHKAKFTIEDVLTIRERAAAGEVYRRMAEEYGVYPSAISQIARGAQWAHVGGPRTFKQAHPKRKRANS